MSETPTQLLPCPFCGGIAETDARRSYREITSGRLGQAFAIYCLSCSADMTFCHADHDGLNAAEIEALAVEQWNTRAPDAERDTLRNQVGISNAVRDAALETRDRIEARAERAEAELAEARALLKRVAECGTFTAELRDLSRAFIAKEKPQ